ncbi:MAG: hypothetical protein ABSF84_15430 [Acidimicrobiales bacterium]|jgi:hypothetical protein
MEISTPEVVVHSAALVNENDTVPEAFPATEPVAVPLYVPVSVADVSGGKVSFNVTVDDVPLAQNSSYEPLAVKPARSLAQVSGFVVTVPLHVPPVGKGSVELVLVHPESVPEKVTVCFTGLPDRGMPGLAVAVPVPGQVTVYVGAFAASAGPPVAATTAMGVTTMSPAAAPTHTCRGVGILTFDPPCSTRSSAKARLALRFGVMEAINAAASSRFGLDLPDPAPGLTADDARASGNIVTE